MWSGVNIAGIRLREINPNAGLEGDSENWNECHKDVVNAAYEVIKLKGYTSWAIGLSCADIASSILRNTNSVKAVSTLVEGIHGIDKEVVSVAIISVITKKLFKFLLVLVVAMCTQLERRFEHCQAKVEP